MLPVNCSCVPVGPSTSCSRLELSTGPGGPMSGVGGRKDEVREEESEKVGREGEGKS